MFSTCRAHSYKRVLGPKKKEYIILTKQQKEIRIELIAIRLGKSSYLATAILWHMRALNLQSWT